MRSMWSFYRIMVVGSGKGLPSRGSLAGVGARTVALGLQQSPNLKGSSGESWTMNKRLIQLDRVTYKARSGGSTVNEDNDCS